MQVRHGASHFGQRISAPKRPPAANPERLRAAESRQKHPVHPLAPDRGVSAASGDASPVSVPLKSVPASVICVTRRLGWQVCNQGRRWRDPHRRGPELLARRDIGE